MYAKKEDVVVQAAIDLKPAVPVSRASTTPTGFVRDWKPRRYLGNCKSDAGMIRANRTTVTPAPR